MSRFLCYDIYKILNNLNPKFLNGIFSAETNKLIIEQYNLNFVKPKSLKNTHAPH